ncbi:uncharacterized protein LOC132737911 isoform X2 [Ruditapes philippinarum]|uniref:uncharacterized protein LOC132737911 isoform X2 n=1 Tax=Ruditapes philippinarum TaxID=129788 RepID=UPI00295C19EA|nr:uncharacterized protein LOC132737911 isoform X2 [Ruditapes philippinarum]
MNPLAATQRDFIRHHNERNENIEIEELGNVVSTDQVSVDMNTNKSQAKEQTVVFVLKCLILVTVFLALLIGTAVIVVEANKDDDPTSRGRVFTERPQEECPDKISVVLGETYSIQCTFPTRLNPSNVTAIYKNVADAKTSDFRCTMKVNKTINVQCTSVNATKCSSIGDVEIRLIDSKNKVKHTRTVGIDIKVHDRDFSTTTKQVYNGNGSTSTFHLSCESKGYCLSHDMKFVEYKTIKDITETMSCKTVYSGDDGYTVSCNTEVSSDVIYQYGNGSHLYCLLMQGTEEVYKREFSLPGCNDYAVQKKGWYLTEYIQCSYLL